ncbi:MAG TPA: hypothetical protein VJY39_11695 [Acidisphaera sp.]|nr:hypothetical protein [Acidisphaera sp.]
MHNALRFIVMPGDGPASTPLSAARKEGVDGRPAPTMTMEAERLDVAPT